MAAIQHNKHSLLLIAIFMWILWAECTRLRLRMQLQAQAPNTFFSSSFRFFFLASMLQFCEIEIEIEIDLLSSVRNMNVLINFIRDTLRVCDARMCRFGGGYGPFMLPYA